MKLISDHIFAWEMFKLLNGADKKHATMLSAMEARQQCSQIKKQKTKKMYMSVAAATFILQLPNYKTLPPNVNYKIKITFFVIVAASLQLRATKKFFLIFFFFFGGKGSSWFFVLVDLGFADRERMRRIPVRNAGFYTRNFGGRWGGGGRSALKILGGGRKGWKVN